MINVNKKSSGGGKVLNITIEGDPTPQSRPRFRRIGKFVSTYDTLSKKKKELGEVIKSQIKMKPIESPITMMLTFHMPIPKSIKGIEENDVHVKRPDIDNLAKYVLDMLNGIAYKDDNQIFELNLLKTYSKRPRTEIIIIY